MSEMPERLLSVIIPAYNEERFVGQLVEKVLAVDLTPLGIRKEVLVIDDHSSDRTPEIVARIPGVTLHRLERNGGKGRAVKEGLRRASGDLLIIQDADLEYDPEDYRTMVEALDERNAGAVYGSRYLDRGRYPNQSLPAYLGGRSLSVSGWLFTGRFLTDTVTALKLFRREVIHPLIDGLRTDGFELDHELTAKVLARGHRIVEVPIRYYPRSKAEGKKIGFSDWVSAIRTFARFRKG